MEIPKSVTYLGASAFEGCSGINVVNINNSTTAIGDFCFLNCTGISKILMPESISEIGESILYNSELERNLSPIIYAKETTFSYQWAQEQGFYIVDPVCWNDSICKVTFEANGSKWGYDRF